MTSPWASRSWDRACGLARAIASCGSVLARRARVKAAGDKGSEYDYLPLYDVTELVGVY